VPISFQKQQNNCVSISFLKPPITQYDVTREFNVEWKAEWGQLSTRNQNKTKKKKLKTNKTPVRSNSKICEGSPMDPERLWRKGFVKQMSFKSGVKGW